MDALTDQDRAAAFLQSFREKCNEILKDLEGPTDVRSKISQLRKHLVQAIPFLPPYDRRQCEIQVSDLEKRVTERRSSETSKSRFAFKRTAVASKLSPEDIVGAGEVPTPIPQMAEVMPMNTLQMTISERTNEIITLHSLYSLGLREDRGRPTSLLISHIDSCIINLLPRASTNVEPAPESLPITIVHVRNIRRTVLILPKISGSVLLHDCHDSLVVIDCQQMRMHTSSNTVILLYVPTIPVIEHCSDLRVGPYPASLPTSASDSKHHELQDFNWIKEGPSPNWSPLDHSPIEFQWDVSTQDWKLVPSGGESEMDRSAVLRAVSTVE
ncbi:tubulin binding cofactor C-domain-containing protein [Cantharellus anzutake]|uniref:tubulin binding cofactor C-domain-containing protein n=1 Tax=Cantharellus anzutake TaxID=1750568 RepID=UPI001907EB9E|nr:tubulin binding cofactor C-domain-containing protein [Cantharellus anzutake]KAF8337065.1 tubulin binding cofactor C-domain-containing protein [Cantharellus anzutake]